MLFNVQIPGLFMNIYKLGDMELFLGMLTPTSTTEKVVWVLKLVAVLLLGPDPTAVVMKERIDRFMVVGDYLKNLSTSGSSSTFWI